MEFKTAMTSSILARLPKATSGSIVLEATATSASMPGVTATARVSFQVNDPPTVPARKIQVLAGKPMAVALGISEDDDAPPPVHGPGSLPGGLTLTTEPGGALRWSSPVLGSYPIEVSAVDAHDQGASGTYVNEVVDQLEPEAEQSQGGGGATGAWASRGLLLASLALAGSRRPT